MRGPLQLRTRRRTRSLPPKPARQIAGRDTRWDAPYSGKYTDNAKWVCRPGLPDNLCARALSITDLNTDGTTSVSMIPATRADVGVDCFYVYPTVDPGVAGAAAQSGLPDIPVSSVVDVAKSQVVPLRELCNIYAPLYRQASLTSLQADEQTQVRGLEFG